MYHKVISHCQTMSNEYMSVSDAGSTKLVRTSYLYDLSHLLNADVTMYYDVTMYFPSVHGKTITDILSKSAFCNATKMNAITLLICWL